MKPYTGTWNWALSGYVDVTAVTYSMVLITHPENKATGFTLEATEDGELRVNGVNIMNYATDNDISILTGIADAVLVGMPSLGDSARVRAEDQKR